MRLPPRGALPSRLFRFRVFFVPACLCFCVLRVAIHDLPSGLFYIRTGVGWVAGGTRRFVLTRRSFAYAEFHRKSMPAEAYIPSLYSKLEGGPLFPPLDLVDKVEVAVPRCQHLRRCRASALVGSPPMPAPPTLQGATQHSGAEIGWDRGCAIQQSISARRIW